MRSFATGAVWTLSLILPVIVVLTAMFQFPSFKTLRIFRKDSWRLFPNWGLFAPRPMQSDYLLIVRDFLADGCFSPWRDAPLVEQRRLFHAVYNPHRRNAYAARLVAKEFLTWWQATPREPSVVSLNHAYIALLGTAIKAPPGPGPGAVGRQFALIEVPAYEREGGVGIALLSAVHRLDSSGTP